MSEHHLFKKHYQDPNWSKLNHTSGIPKAAWDNAKQLLQEILSDDTIMQSWFGCFATRLDSSAEQHMPLALVEEEQETLAVFMDKLNESQGLLRDGTCRMAYNESTLQFFINGCEWQIDGVSLLMLQYVANNRVLDRDQLLPFLTTHPNQLFLYELWILQWLGMCP